MNYSILKDISMMSLFQYVESRYCIITILYNNQIRIMIYLEDGQDD